MGGVYMKKIIIFIVLFSFIICLCSCDSDPYKGKRPTDYENSKWVCENVDMYFTVGNADEYIFNSSKEVIKFEFLWSKFRPEVTIRRADNKEILFKGQCKFSSETFKISITEENSYFESLPLTLIFNKAN